MSKEQPRKKILAVISDMNTSGTVRHVLSVFSRLTDIADVSVVCTKATDEDKKLFSSHGLELFVVRTLFGYPLSLITYGAGLMTVIKKVRPDIIHSFTPHAYASAGLASLVLKTGKTVYSRRCMHWYQDKKNVLARYEHWLHEKTDRLIANSEAVRFQLRAEAPKGKPIDLIYSGIDVEPYHALGPRDELKKRLSIDSDSFVFAMVADYVYHKGYADLLEALAQVNTSLPKGWKLVCAGADPDNYGEKLKELVSQHKLDAHVVWLGCRNDIPAIYGAADVGVLPSHEEGFAHSIVEGMAAGVPMVVTRVGGNTEAVLNNKNGVVVYPHDTKALGTALVELSMNEKKRRELGFAAIKYVDRMFTLDKCLADYRRLYKSLEPS